MTKSRTTLRGGDRVPHFPSPLLRSEVALRKRAAGGGFQIALKPGGRLERRTFWAIRNLLDLRDIRGEGAIGTHFLRNHGRSDDAGFGGLAFARRWSSASYGETASA